VAQLKEAYFVLTSEKELVTSITDLIEGNLFKLGINMGV